MLLRARSLAMGYSGARPEVAETILALLNAGITPVVPEHGSLGASGDLAPLAHCALALIGEGEVGRRRRPAPGRRGPRRGRYRAADPAGEGGPGADQRHRRHPRDAAAGRLGPALAAARRRCDGRDVGRGPARDRPRLRRGPDRAAPAARAGGERRQPASPARRLADRRQPPRERSPRPGRLLAALRPAGERRRPGRARTTPIASPTRSCARRSTTR